MYRSDYADSLAARLQGILVEIQQAWKDGGGRTPVGAVYPFHRDRIGLEPVDALLRGFALHKYTDVNQTSARLFLSRVRDAPIPAGWGPRDAAHQALIQEFARNALASLDDEADAAGGG